MLAECWRITKGRRKKAMTYTKPTVAVLGDAVDIIQGPPKSGDPVDTPSAGSVAAYELDD